jgi:hypothetical protein
MTARGAVSALVLASRGGARLARALASVAWADERLVWDPARRLAPGDVPAGARVEHGEPAPSGDWVLLLVEDEVVPPALAAAVGAAVGPPDAGTAFGIRRELHALGATLHLRGAPVRLARRDAARPTLGPGLLPRLAGPAGARRTLAPALEVHAAASLAEIVQDLDADGAALAALLDRARRRPRLGHLVGPPLAAAVPVLTGRAAGRVGWVRWMLAVLVGYRTLLAWAKLWERRWLGTPA